jgi:hypothetical protein
MSPASSGHEAFAGSWRGTKTRTGVFTEPDGVHKEIRGGSLAYREA